MASEEFSGSDICFLSSQGDVQALRMETSPSSAVRFAERTIVTHIMCSDPMATGRLELLQDGMTVRRILIAKGRAFEVALKPHVMANVAVFYKDGVPGHISTAEIRQRREAQHPLLVAKTFAEILIDKRRPAADVLRYVHDFYGNVPPATRSHCKRCDVVPLPAAPHKWDAIDVETVIEFCDACSRALAVGNAFEFIGMILERHGEMAQSFWRIDPIVFAEVKLRAELTVADSVTTHMREVHALSEDDWLDYLASTQRRTKAEDALWATDWKGRRTHWLKTTFDALRDQHNRYGMEWPHRHLGAYKG